MRKKSLYFTVLFKELYASLANVGNVREKEKMKEVAISELLVETERKLSQAAISCPRWISPADSIQADSKRASTKQNYEKRNCNFLSRLNVREPSCWDDGSVDVFLRRNTAETLLRYLAVKSYTQKTGKLNPIQHQRIVTVRFLHFYLPSSWIGICINKGWTVMWVLCSR